MDKTCLEIPPNRLEVIPAQSRRVGSFERVADPANLLSLSPSSFAIVIPLKSYTISSVAVAEEATASKFACLVLSVGFPLTFWVLFSWNCGDHHIQHRKMDEGNLQ